MKNNNLMNFKGLKVLVIGDIMLDQYFYGSVNRISPEAPVPVMNLENTELKAGGAANVALNILALGAEVVLLSAYGNDLSGAKLRETLEENYIKTGNVLQVEDEVTTVKTRLIAGGQHIMRLDEENIDELDPENEQKLISKLQHICSEQKIDAIIIEDYNKGLLGPTLISAIRTLGQEKKIFISVDPKFYNFEEYKDVDLLKPNLREVNLLLNTSYEAVYEDLEQASLILKQKLSYKKLMITLGEKGVFIDDGETKEIIATQSLDVVDVCGAGDAVISIATLCLISDLSLKETAFWANKAGAIVCSHLGVTAVHRADLESQK